MKIKTIISILISAAIIGIIIVTQAWQFVTPENIKNLLLSAGKFSPIVYAVLYAIASFIPFLSPIMSVAGGLVFGAVWGTIITVIVATLSATLPFLIVKRFGKKWAEKKLQGSRFEKYHEKANKNSFLFVFYMRLIPAVPYELQHYIAGLTEISLGKYLLATLLGILPGTFAFSFLGESITHIGSPKFWIAIGVFIVAFAIPLGIQYFKKK